MKISQSSVQPLESNTISGLSGSTVAVRDGEGREYIRTASDSGSVDFLVGGSLGTHVVFDEDADGRVLATGTFLVDCTSSVTDETGRYKELFDKIHDTLYEDWYSGSRPQSLRYKGKYYRYYVSWIRDHVHSLKGMKYFDNDIKTGIELYADTQREDGMIWDKVKPMYGTDLQTWRDHDFAKGDFIRRMEGHPNRRLTRIPVENDVEFLYLEGLYYTWKACGDTEWMTGLLDSAIRAVRYSLSDQYRFSTKHQLLKRGYTIDTWDFQSNDDAARMGGSVMNVDPEKTEFNVFYGDNTGMAVGCEYLAEMLREAGRDAEADEFATIAAGIRERLEKLAWNGRFYTHMIPENPDAERDLGDTPTDKQVTLSNAYSINRNIGHDKAVRIINTYQDIRREMPETAPGEFYNCYPPFTGGFNRQWHYVNGGVSTIVAGELSHGAFEHGYEAYAADILDRVLDWSRTYGGYLYNCMVGKLPDPVKQTFTFLDLREHANGDFRADTVDGVIGWGLEPDHNDMYHMPTGRQTFHGIDFDVIRPEDNNHRTLISLSNTEPFAQSVRLDVKQTAGSVYLLHAGLQAKPGTLVGWFLAHYDDGTHATQYVHTGAEVHNWFMPLPDNPNAGGNKGRKQTNLRQAWNGPNRLYENVGFSLYGWNNPSPEKTIDHIEFVAAETGAIWNIMGVTLSDTCVSLPASPISGGIPDMWGCGALAYALVEGLAGVKNTGVGMNSVMVAPRWVSAQTNRADVTIKLPASGGYVRYAYAYAPDKNTLDIRLAAKADAIDLRVLMPDGHAPVSLMLDGASVPFETETVEHSVYACTRIQGLGVHEVTVGLTRHDTADSRSGSGDALVGESAV